MNDALASKSRLRQQIGAIRNAVEGRAGKSRIICDRLLGLPPVSNAESVCCFVSFRSEVDTHRLIEQLLESGKQLSVPWCDGDDLQLCRIRSLQELEHGTLGILEPGVSLREDESRRVHIGDCQVAIVPGLAFTVDGKRLGYGRGYYDRLLRDAANVLKIAPAFSQQVVADLPTAAHDVPMDVIVTETNIWYRSG